MKTAWAFLAGADAMGMVFARLIRSADAFLIFGIMFMLAVYMFMFRETERG